MGKMTATEMDGTSQQVSGETAEIKIIEAK